MALLCKQNTAILGALAYGLYVPIWKKVEKVYCFRDYGPCSFFLVFLWFQISSHGYYFKETVLWLSYGYQPELLIYYLKNSFVPECGWLLAGLILMWVKKPASLFPRCMMVFVFLALLGLGQMASAENYYLEFILYGLFLWGKLGWKRNPDRQKGEVRGFLLRVW